MHYGYYFFLFATVELMTSFSILALQENASTLKTATLGAIVRDEQGIRYKLVQENVGPFNWLFIPGGPGADSRYFIPLIQSLHLPGKTWLIDLPENGDNMGFVTIESFDIWLSLLPECIKQFDKPIYIGHSFGGMIALSYPFLENILSGLIIMSAVPMYDPQEIKKMRTERNIVLSPEAGNQFKAQPTNKTLKAALLTNAPCHFPLSSLAKGRAFFEELPFNAQPMVWWVGKLSQYKVLWVPQKVATLIIGGSEDCINPISLFQKDMRFKRKNISLIVLEGSGHFPWFENKDSLARVINDFARTLLTHV